MKYLELTHPTEDFDILVACDEDNKFVCATDINKDDISISDVDKVEIQKQINSYYEN